MFKVTGDFSHGAFAENGWQNGFQTMIMQRQMNIDNAIEEFEIAIERGYHPNLVKEDILNRNHLTDLTQAEADRIIKRVEEIYQSKGGHNEFI